MVRCCEANSADTRMSAEASDLSAIEQTNRLSISMPEQTRIMGESGPYAVAHQNNWDMEKEKLLNLYAHTLQGAS